MIYAKFTGEIDCDCGSIFVLTGRFDEDEFLDFIDFIDDNDSITMNQYKKENADTIGYNGA